MRISARNQIKGTVVEVKKGATTSHVRVDIGNGQIITSSITNEAVDELGIKAGGMATSWRCSAPRPPGRQKNRAAATSSNGVSGANARR
jgi:molybdopterin-binding protein